MLSGLADERGQVLVLFVVFFSMVLVLLAYAVDQGYWFGQRRIVQKDADVVARSAALGFLVDLTNGSAAEAGDVEDRALEAALANGVESGEIEINDANPGVCTDNAGNTITAPSLEFALSKDTARLFSRLPMVADNNDDIEIGARAVACVGAVQRLRIGGSNDPDDEENTLKAMNIVLRSDVGGPRSCFVDTTTGTLILGRECVIWDAGLVDSNPRRTLFTQPSPSQCRGSGSPDTSDIDDDTAMTCIISSSGTTCPAAISTTSCVRTATIDDDEDGDLEDVLDEMHDRLDSSTDCSGPDSASFAAAFEDADGREALETDHAPPAFSGGSSADRSRVYLQTNCFNNPRIVMLPIVRGGSDGSGGGRRVRGFATVYITGCYFRNTPIVEPNTNAQSRDCDGFDDPENCDESGGGDDDDDGPTEGCEIEIRGVPIHLYVSDGSLGGMLSVPSSQIANFPVTIQTVR